MGLSEAAGTPATSRGVGMIARRIEKYAYSNSRCVFEAVRRRLPPSPMFNAGLVMAKPLAPIQATFCIMQAPWVPKDAA